MLRAENNAWFVDSLLSITVIVRVNPGKQE